ncbi:cellulase family glycosylhydrolase [Mariniflexile gromovii]|uniref:Cellulase family glycosylhydrolase n=1 Tax=Mariniflexile gromovii TaxID=362523 RepID=A0ABS4BXX5_9FLAO|nr:cellulase family glycosylhydrolase [Mariniflexile gromovii]MBP0905438.1 cellulase family glycosylhydrolase [Mariniflexile gromovii]
MKRTMLFSVLLFVCLGMLPANSNGQSKVKQQTVVSIEGEKFFINGKPTYEGREWQGNTIEGLLMNSRMVQGVFDDLNPETAGQWKYPDTQKWDADRNTDEFIAAMDAWYAKGLLAFTVNMQGGSPLGYGNKGWINSAIDPEGELRADYMSRLEKILDRANEKGMVVILGIFYFGQDEYIKDEAAIIKAVDNTINWLFKKEYRNVIIELNNECDIHYDHEILTDKRVDELIKRVKSKVKNGYSYLVGTSFSGGKIPAPNVVKESDFILLHGNSVKDPKRIAEMVAQVKTVNGYKPMPIVFNEDDHFDFDKPTNNMVEAIKAYASWGYFDFRMKGEEYDHGFQSVPVNWQISSPRKNAFFNKLEEITGGLK